jgi:hypothetical protein
VCEVLVRGRTICAEVSAAGLGNGLFRVALLPAVYPLVCSNEGDLVPSARSEAEPSDESRWSKQLTPGREKPLPCPFTHALRNFVSEFLPREAAAIEGISNGFKERVGLC